MSMHSDPVDKYADRRFDARFSDGTSAGSETVGVALSPRGIEISRDRDPQPLVWPYGAIVTAEPLSDHSIDALVTYRYQQGASLFVPGGAFARALAEVAPHLTARAERWRNTRPWLWVAGAVVLVSGLIALSDLSPARTLAGLMPDAARQTLGAQVIGSMTRGKTVCEASEGRAALDRLAARLSAAAGNAAAFKLTVVEWSLVNAFAAPGEQIVVTSGLIAQAQSPEELAGVIAHEMGHGIERHPETGIVRAVGLTAAAELMLGGGSGTLTNLGLALAQLSYTRAAEREADDHALAILRATSISAKGLADFFVRMGKGEKDDGGVSVDLLRSHPQTAERLQHVLSAPTYPTKAAMSAPEWAALRAICEADAKAR
ncbi:MAG: M48 family metallopeptidase [Hyphomicrobiaceae bacterium]|nr:M48 family metallopeptidase [Hyphomicrobiaceae bacterium]